MYEDYEDEFDNMPIAQNKRELKKFKDFTRALQDAQSSRKDTVTSNINAAAQIATALGSTSGVRHVVQRVISVSKDPRTRKETAVYVADSIMKHVAKRADEGLLRRYEKHFQSHLRNFFKRALRMEATRYSLAERFLKKIIAPWKAHGWFDDELEIVVSLIYNTVPELRERYGDSLLVKGELAHDDAGDDGGADCVVESTPKRLRGATAKAGCPPTPMQPVYFGGMTTPRGLMLGTPTVPKAAGVAGSSAVLLSLPRTPTFDTMYAKTPGTPGMDSKIPMTPAAGTPAAMTPGAFACGTPAAVTPGQFASSTPGFQAGTPGHRSAPGTPAFQPFTPGGAAGPPPGTPRGMSQPFTPGRGAAAPFTPSGAQPFTPGGAVAPFTPGGAVVPFTPSGLVAPFTPGAAVPGTPRGAVPFTPVGPGGIAPGTPRGAVPFTPMNAVPGTPHGAAPVTPAFFGVKRPVPGTPAFAPVTGGDAAPRTPAGPGQAQDSAEKPALKLVEDGGGAGDKFHGNANAIPGTP